MKTTTENAVRTTARLYEARDAAKSILPPEQYRERIAQMQGHIRKQMDDSKQDGIKAALTLAEKVQNPTTLLFLLAAYVEMIEPS